MNTVAVKLIANVEGDDGHIKNIELGVTEIEEHKRSNQPYLKEIAEKEFGDLLEGLEVNHITTKRESGEAASAESNEGCLPSGEGCLSGNKGCGFIFIKMGQIIINLIGMPTKR